MYGSAISTSPFKFASINFKKMLYSTFDLKFDLVFFIQLKILFEEKETVDNAIPIQNSGHIRQNQSNF